MSDIINVPVLRFGEFNGEWEEKKYGDIYSFYTTNSLSRDKLNYDDGRVKNIHYGDIHTKFNTMFNIQNEYVPFVNSDIDLSKIKEESYCLEGDLVIADASEDYNDIGKTIEMINLNNEKVVAGLHTFLARPNKHDIILGYMSYLLQSWKVRKQVMTIAQGSKVLSLSTKRLSTVKLNLPKNPEQQKIATFLTSIDTKIEQLTKKEKLLSSYKKGVMQKIFNQGIRFKDDDGGEFGDWEEKRLREIATFLKGKGISKSDIVEDGVLECIRYGELYTVYNETIHNVQSKTNLNKDNLIFSKFNDVIIPASGETQIDIATASCILKDNVALSGDLNIIRTNINGVFLAYYLNNFKKIDIARLSQGISVVHLYSSQLKLLKLNLPPLKEQTKIANFLSSIDKKIELTTQQLHEVKAFKKSLLQQMFV
ncbi:MAG: Type I restriction-modification system, specificity subunit S (EC [uncultured Sulfurovum sp.]|uniref:Type I restriction-modification system, specificity subunit S (EC) n=1 Tax=uncultured Sulfurovum sp. TaxID=269237 RepID=A0A6S6S3M2_9BACT|nr:MAG: Type I restriction-modification system, specificity subunit S (EC [uncultured Sulfurovum sp.]